MPSSPTLHRAVYFRTLSCGHGGGSVSGNTKHGSYQFSQASGRWDADASDWKECHLDLSRNLRRSSASQRSASQRWQKQVRNIFFLKYVDLSCRAVPLDDVGGL